MCCEAIGCSLLGSNILTILAKAVRTSDLTCIVSFNWAIGQSTDGAGSLTHIMGVSAVGRHTVWGL